MVWAALMIDWKPEPQRLVMGQDKLRRMDNHIASGRNILETLTG
jgi:hypothetical protein